MSLYLVCDRQQLSFKLHHSLYLPTTKSKLLLLQSKGHVPFVCSECTNQCMKGYNKLTETAVLYLGQTIPAPKQQHRQSAQIST